MAYTKLFQKILASSIWNEDMATRLVWITLLCMKDENHIVQGSIGGIAHMARVPIKDCAKAMERLEGPDPDDSSGVQDGRRIERLERGGWLVINGAAYRDSKDEDERRAWMANYMREYRKKQKDRKQFVNNSKQSLTDVNADKHPLTSVNTENGSSQESHGHSVTVQDISGQSETEREKENTLPLFPLSPLQSSSPPLTPPQKEKEREAALVRSPLMKNKDIDELSQNPAYQGIDVRKEAFKFKEWCQTNNRNQSKRRFVNWLNRVS